MDSVPLFVGIDISKTSLDVAFGQTKRTQRFANSEPGRAQLAAQLTALAPQLVVLEATGGYEVPVIAALLEAGLPVARANPAQVRDFARGVGRRAKNDRVDARVLAHFAAVVPLAQLQPQEPAQAELAALTQRRTQVLAMRQAERNRLATCHPAVRAEVQAAIDQYTAQLARLEARQAALVAATPVLAQTAALLTSVPGVGPVVSRCLLADLPELGRTSAKQAAALVGLAPYDRDSGGHQACRHIAGGRAQVRTPLYMATLVAIQHNPVLRAHYQQLLARGKPKKVALIACARKLLVILNAMLRARRPWRADAIAA